MQKCSDRLKLVIRLNQLTISLEVGLMHLKQRVLSLRWPSGQYQKQDSKMRLTPQYLSPLKTWGGIAEGFPTFFLISSFTSVLDVMSITRYLIFLESRNWKISDWCCFTCRNGWKTMNLRQHTLKLIGFTSFSKTCDKKWTIPNYLSYFVESWNKNVFSTKVIFHPSTDAHAYKDFT